jgi:hypothetical protein
MGKLYQECHQTILVARPGKWNAKYYDYLFMQNYITALQGELSFHTTITSGTK